MKYNRTNTSTVFHTTDKVKVLEILEKIGIQEIKFKETDSKFTTVLDRRLTDNKIRLFSYYANKENKKVVRRPKTSHESKVIEIPEIVIGYSGCVISGAGLFFY